MARLATVSTLAALSILGGAIGVHLGKSAVDEIDPSYFGKPETKFHADLVSNRTPDWTRLPAPQYQDASLIQGLGNGCIGCRDYPEEYRPIHEAVVVDLERDAPVETEYEAAQDPTADDLASYEPSRIEPYAHYAIVTAAEKKDEAITAPVRGEAIETGASPDLEASAP